MPKTVFTGLFQFPLVRGGRALGASCLGAPVSITHVAVASLFGVSVATRTGRWRAMTNVAAAWLVTLPIGAAWGRRRPRPCVSYATRPAFRTDRRAAPRAFCRLRT